MEEWKCVIGGYEVSTLGRVRNIENNSKILRPNLDSAGYLKLDLYDITIRIHRLVAEAFIPNPYQLPFVNHKDGIKFYNWVDNLEWVTERDNNLHAVRLKLSASGEQHYKAVLTEKDIPTIRELIAADISNAEIAKLYGVHRGTISEIKRGNSWKNVK